jgi:hypothetical protein
VPLADNLPIGGRIGALRFLGMLVIPSVLVNGVRLSQLSDLAWDDATETLYAVSDKGGLFQLRPVFRDGALIDVKLARAVPLRELKTDQVLRRKRADAEGLAIARTGAPGRNAELLISFERFPRIVRYRADGYALDELPLPAPLADPKAYRDENRMLESVCRDSRFGVLTMPELPLKREAPDRNRLYSLNGKSWRYPIGENRVVSLACLGDGEVLVLESDFGQHLMHTRITLKRARLTDASGSDPLLSPQTLFALDSADGYQLDNFEGIAHHRGNRYFLVSDDNDFFLQQTLLLYFELMDQ